MTVIVGWAPGNRSAGALELASATAQARHEDLVVVTVIPPRWNIPSIARHVDGEFSQWAAETGNATLEQARAALEAMGSPVPTSYRHLHHRSPGTALMNVADETGATVAVIGSSEDGRRGTVEVGSTGDRMLHSARVPVAIAPRGYARPAHGFSSITCAVAGRESDSAVVTTAKALATEAGVPLRLVMFVVRLDTMYPSNVGFDAEDEVAAAAREQGEEFFASLRKSGAIDNDVETEVGLGQGWRAAMDSIKWDTSGLLFLGSNPTDVLQRVFLGTNAAKIVRHSPVPVVVLPA